MWRISRFNAYAFSAREAINFKDLLEGLYQFEESTFVIARDKESSYAALGDLAKTVNRINPLIDRPDTIELYVLAEGKDLDAQLGRIPVELRIIFNQAQPEKWYALGKVRLYFRL